MGETSFVLSVLTGLGGSVIRDILAVALTLMGGVALVIGCFLVSVPVGLIGLGAFLVFEGYMLGLD